MAKPSHALRGKQGQQPQQRTPQNLHVRQEWSGPLPPPAALEAFNRILPNGADRVVKMAEAEQAHRLEYEKTGLVASTREARLGQIVGGLLSFVALGGAIYTAHIGAPWQVSVAFLSLPIMGLVRALIRPRG